MRFGLKLLVFIVRTMTFLNLCTVVFYHSSFPLHFCVIGLVDGTICLMSLGTFKLLDTALLQTPDLCIPHSVTILIGASPFLLTGTRDGLVFLHSLKWTKSILLL